MKKINSLKVATVQFQHKDSDRLYNISVIKRFVKKAASQNVKLIVFPEMCITGYGHLGKLSQPQLVKLAESIPDGPTTQLFISIAKELNIIIGVGLLEKSSHSKLYNSYIVFQPNGQINIHRKLQAFESEYIESGHQYTVFNTILGVKLGVLICYDNNIIENCRITALKGADILLSPSQVGGSLSKSPFALGLIPLDLWENRKLNPAKLRREFRGPKGRAWLMRWLPSRAHDNGFFLLFSNGVGRDENEIRTGNAMILDPYGRIVNETSSINDKMVVAELDLSLLEMSTGRRWIRARRPELYNDLVTPTGSEMNTRDLHTADKIN